MIRLALIAAALAAHGPPAHSHHHVRRVHRLFPSMHIVVPLSWFDAHPPPAPPPGSSAPPPADDPAPPPAPSYPSRTGLDEGEYFVHIAHRTLAAGAVELNLSNFGMDDHDVTIDDADGHQVAQQYLAAGATGQLTPTLAAGQYRVYCSLYGGTHDQAGMHAVLTVVG